MTIIHVMNFGCIFIRSDNRVSTRFSPTARGELQATLLCFEVRFPLRKMWEFPKIRGNPMLGSFMIRVLLFRVLY